MNFPESEPLPNEARGQLEAHGNQLIDRLGAMRELEAERVEVEALDADARLALRQHGDQFLAELDTQREKLAMAPVASKRRFPWAAIAACFIGFVACTWLFDTPDTPGQNLAKEESAVPTNAVPEPVLEPELASDEDILKSTVTVPEPSTSLLALAGVMLLLKRRRE